MAGRMLEIYDIKNLTELTKDLTKEQEALLDYFKALMTKGTKYFIKNIDCEVKILKINNILIPLAISNNNYNDTLYISMLSHYVKYIKEEFNKNNLKLGFLFKFLENYFIKNKINKTVYVNQWFISTNLYPELDNEQIYKITNFLKNEFKDYCIVFKNITKEYNTNLYENLNKQGYKEIVSRQIFIKDKKLKEISKYKYKTKKDLKFYKNSSFKAHKVQNDDDFERIKDIYTMLYIEKYSKYNPCYTKEYFKLVSFNPIFNLEVFKNKDTIASMCLTFAKNNTLAAPAVGYDLTLPKELGLYRIISAFIDEMYEKNYEIHNMSAGVGDFKIQRGAKAYFEYLMIYYKHLPLNRQIMLNFLRFTVNKTIPLLCKYKLCGFV